jgi:ribosome-associated protein
MPLNKNALKMAQLAASTLEDKRAKDVTILDIQEITFITDYFVICTGSSSTHLKTLSETLVEKLKVYSKRIISYEGKPNTGWILIDYGDIVIHLFSEQKRDFYNLEYIWQEAKKIPVEAMKIKG